MTTLTVYLRKDFLQWHIAVKVQEKGKRPFFIDYSTAHGCNSEEHKCREGKGWTNYENSWYPVKKIHLNSKKSIDQIKEWAETNISRPGPFAGPRMAWTVNCATVVKDALEFCCLMEGEKLKLERWNWNPGFCCIPALVPRWLITSPRAVFIAAKKIAERQHGTEHTSLFKKMANE